jgi:sulfate adenylyltransferase subunit 2
MISFRDEMAESVGARLIVHTNEEAIGDGTQPFKVGTQRCCGLLKTKALLDALQAGNFDAAIGGARRDEERSRAKSGSSRCATRTASGIRSASGPSCGAC